MSKSVMRKTLPAFLPSVLSLVMLLSSCSSSETASKGEADNSPAVESFSRATVEMGKKKYDNAILLLEPLMFSTRATDLEDDVLNSLAQAYFETKQYMLAADIYRRLLQQTPDSPYARNAQFQLGRSYEKLSPSYELDQEYTFKAINEFAIYLDQYPEEDTQKAAGDVELYRELLKVNPANESYKAKYEAAMAELSEGSPARYAREALPGLREKLAHNRYSIARQYVQLKKYGAAEIFFNTVIEQFPDTKLIEPAWIGKIDTEIARSKWFEARQSIERFKDQFPDRHAAVEAAYTKVMAHFSESREPGKQE